MSRKNELREAIKSLDNFVFECMLYSKTTDTFYINKKLFDREEKAIIKAFEDLPIDYVIQDGDTIRSKCITIILKGDKR